MTTMFIQLRRVVYLLVLLHCVCVASAASSGGDGQDSSDVKLIEEGVVDKESFKKTVTEAYEHIVNMTGCLTVIGQEMELRKENTERAEAILKDLTGLVEEIEGLADRGEVKTDWIKKNKERMQLDKKNYDDVSFSINHVFQMQKNCSGDLGYLVKGKEKYDKVHERFLKLNDQTPEGKNLVEKADKAKQALSDLSERCTTAQKELEKQWTFVESMKKKMDALKQSLGDDATRVMNTKEPERDELIKTVGTILDDFAKKVEEEKAKAKKEYPPLVQEGPVEEKRSEAEKQPSDAKEGGGEAQRPSEEKEQKEDEEEKSTKEEDGKKEVEGEEKARDENTTRVEREEGGEKDQNEKEEEVERRNNTKDEGATQSQEEKVGEKNGREREEKMEEKAKIEAEQAMKVLKESDGRSSPALVQSPLLLILFCVLGCTLVC